VEGREVRCCVVESGDARFLVVKWVPGCKQWWHGPSALPTALTTALPTACRERAWHLHVGNLPTKLLKRLHRYE